MADDQKSDKKRPWLAVMGSRVKRLYRAVDDRCVQWRYGSYADQKAAIVARLKEVQDGAEALQEAKQNNVKISVVSKRRIGGVKGRFSRRSNRPLLRISACGDLSRMASTLWHELRHLQQHVARGDLSGGTSRLFDTRRQHFISLMIEADAYTSQTLMCLRQKKAGHPEYLDSFLARDSVACIRIKSFLAERTAEGFASEALFARALFADVVKHGLSRYQQKYFKSYRTAFKKAQDADAFCKMLSTKRQSPDFALSAALMRQYGVGPLEARSVSALARAFYKAQDRDVQETLTLIEDTVKNASQLTQEQFAAARDSVLGRTASLVRKFDTQPAWPRSVLQKVLHHGG